MPVPLDGLGNVVGTEGPTEKRTVTAGTGLPDASSTVAVTQCWVPTGLTAVSGVSVSLAGVCRGVKASFVVRRVLLPPSPPTAKTTPLTTPTPTQHRGVGIEATVVHVSVGGSYASTVLTTLVAFAPPTAYKMPFTTAAPTYARAVDIGAFVVQVFVAGS